MITQFVNTAHTYYKIARWAIMLYENHKQGNLQSKGSLMSVTSVSMQLFWLKFVQTAKRRPIPQS